MDGRSPLAEAVARLPLATLRKALAGANPHLVGGFVRDVLRGSEPGPDVDVAIDGDLEALLAALDPGLAIDVEASHDRFGTATVVIDGFRVDLSRTRSETYPAPGALPEVFPAPIERDLARRDFTVNAMAVPLDAPEELLDPFDGRRDLRAGRLRILHERSFADDPTRAIRGARYAARLGLVPAPRTLELLRGADLGTVSEERRRAELARLAAEPVAARGFGLLAEWGVAGAPAAPTELIEGIERATSREPWTTRTGARVDAILLAAEGGERTEAALRLAAAEPGRPSEAVRLAASHSPPELLLAAAAGARWIEEYLAEWSEVGLEIDGDDLLAAGIPRGPAIGAGLRGALERKLDGELSGGREAELELAVALAREAI